jgi:hypothetical protein
MIEVNQAGAFAAARATLSSCDAAVLVLPVQSVGPGRRGTTEYSVNSRTLYVACCVWRGGDSRQGQANRTPEQRSESPSGRRQG